MKNANRWVREMRHEQYQVLVERRNILKGMLDKGGLIPKHKQWIDDELKSVRERITNAHREQYKSISR